jgi:hypothetical protein
MGPSGYTGRSRDTTSDSYMLAPLFASGGVERELRWRDPARVASRLGGNECTRAATDVGDI